MKLESADYLQKAHLCKRNAETIAAAGLPDVAAREAYPAVFHAAEAYIFEKTGRAAKTHRGVRTQFGRLALSEPRIAREFVSFLGEGYELKTTGDYGIGSAAQTISSAEARAAIDTTARLIDCIAALLP